MLVELHIDYAYLVQKFYIFFFNMINNHLTISFFVVFISISVIFTGVKLNIFLNKLLSASLRTCTSFNLNNLRFISLLSS